MRHPVAVLVPTLGVPADPGLAVPARPVQRAGRLDPAGRRCRRARRSTGWRASSARASSRRSSWPCGPSARRPRPRTSPRCTTTRAAWPPTRASRASTSLVDVDPRLTPVAVQAALRQPDRATATGIVQRRWRATTKGDLTAFTIYTPVWPEPRRGPRAGRAICVHRAGRSRRRRAWQCSWVAARPMSRTSSPGRGRTSRGPALFILVATYLVLFVLLRSVVLPAKALVMNTPLDRRVSFGALVWIFQDGNLSALLGLPAARVRRDDPAGDPVLRPVRAVHGLRGLPAVADEGGLGPDRRQHARRSPAGWSAAAGS